MHSHVSVRFELCSAT